MFSSNLRETCTEFSCSGIWVITCSLNFCLYLAQLNSDRYIYIYLASSSCFTFRIKICNLLCWRTWILYQSLKMEKFLSLYAVYSQQKHNSIVKFVYWHTSVTEYIHFKFLQFIHSSCTANNLNDMKVGLHPHFKLIRNCMMRLFRSTL